MESPPLKLNVRRDEDRISALPDELLLRILERLDLPEAVRAGAVSTRWRHLPHQLSLVIFQIHHFRGATLVETMDALAGALLSVPKLRTVLCHSWRYKNPPVRFGYVPELRKVSLAFKAKVWQVPFLLSECLSRSATNLSKLHLNFCDQMIWIQPEHPKQPTAIFRNLADVSLSGIFPECDLSWTLFILEAAPALQKFTLSRAQLCAKTAVDSAGKTNVVWGPSKDFKHFNLKKLAFQGFEEEDKVTNYIRLVMERAVGLKRIVLLGELPCKDCNDCKRKCKVDKARRRRVKEQLAHGSCSSVEIIICNLNCQH